MTDPTLIDEARVLEIVPVSERTLRRWVSAGRFPKPVRLGGDDERHNRKAWLREEILAWVKARLAERGEGAA